MFIEQNNLINSNRTFLFTSTTVRWKRTAYIMQQFNYSTKKWRKQVKSRRRNRNRFRLFWYFGSNMKCYDDTPPTTISVMWYSIVHPISGLCLWFHDAKTPTCSVHNEFYCYPFVALSKVTIDAQVLNTYWFLLVRTKVNRVVLYHLFVEKNKFHPLLYFL